jgi:Domain of unknown function (DUF5655)
MPNDLSRNCPAAHARGLRFPSEAGAEAETEKTKRPNNSMEPTRVSMAVTKSQIAFRRKRAFAWAWIPDRYLRGQHAPLVLSFAFRYRDSSPRWKQIVEPSRGRFMHHVELNSPAELDQEVTQWLWEAWAEAA